MHKNISPRNPARLAPRAAFGLALALSAAGAAAQTPPPAPTLLTTSYPAPGCNKPPAPPKSGPLNNNLEIQLFSSQVERYNSARAEYSRCVKEYVAAARADIKRITDAANALIEEANQP